MNNNDFHHRVFFERFYDYDNILLPAILVISIFDIDFNFMMISFYAIVLFENYNNILPWVIK